MTRRVMLLVILASLVLAAAVSVSAQSTRLLTDGQFWQDTVSAEVYKWYNISIDSAEPTPELRVSLTAYNGHPQLFVSVNQPTPTNATARWAKYESGSATLLVTEPELTAACVTYPCWVSVGVYGSWLDSDYALALTTTANHSTIHEYSQSPQLFRRSTIAGVLGNSSAVARYLLQYPAQWASNVFHIVATPTYGSAGLIVSTNASLAFNYYDAIAFGDLSDFHTGPWGSVWFTNLEENGWDSQVIGISPADPGFCAGCNYTIIVFNNRPFAPVEYSLSFFVNGAVPSDTNSALSMPNTETVLRIAYANDVHYYDVSIGPNAPPLDLSASVTHILGNTTMSVSSKPCALSAASDYQWNSAKALSHVYVNRSVCTGSGCGMCMMVVANSNSTYSVTSAVTMAQHPDRSPILVINGLPFEDILPDGHVRFFVHAQAFTDSLSVSISRKYGSFLLWNCGIFPSWAFPVSLNWRSLDRSNCSVVLTGDGLGAITSTVIEVMPVLPEGRYIFALQPINTHGADLDYTLTVGLGYTPQVLQTNVPLPSMIVPVRISSHPAATFNKSLYIVHWQYDDHQIANTPAYYQRDLVISASMFSGHVTLYASNLTWPTPIDYQWMSNRGRFDNLVIPFAALRRGPYFIAAIADTAVTFALTASIYGRAAPVHLQPGLPFNAFITKNDVHYFYLTLPQSLSSNVTVSVTPQRGRASLYVSNTTSFPDPFNANTYARSSVSNVTHTATQVVFIPHLSWCNLPNPAPPGGLTPDNRCRYVIAVYGDSDAHYQLQTILPQSTNVLQAGIPQLAAISYLSGRGRPTLMPGRFQFSVPSNDANVTLSLTMLHRGDPNQFPTFEQNFTTLRVSRDPFSVSFQPEWTLNGTVNFHDRATIFIDADDPHFSPLWGMKGTYWVEVAAPLYSLYTLSLSINNRELADAMLNDHRVSNSSSVTVIDGQPQQRTVFSEGQHFALFQYDVSSSRHQGPIRLTAQSLYGGPLAIFARNDGLVPRLDVNDRNQRFAFDDAAVTTLRIDDHYDPHDPHRCDSASNMCTWMILVASLPSNITDSPFASFTFTATTDYQLLLMGEPIANIVLEPLEVAHFILDVDTTATSMTPLLAELTVASGSAQFWLCENGAPCSNTTALRGVKVDGVNSELRANVTRGRYLLTVVNDRFEQPCRVSVVATTTDVIELIDGVEQFAVITSEWDMGMTGITFRYDYVDFNRAPWMLHVLPENPQQELYIFATFDGTRPSSTNNQWNSTTSEANWRNGVVFFDESSPYYADHVTIHVLVQLGVHVGIYRVPFIVLAYKWTHSFDTVLNDGRASETQVLFGDESKHFEFTLSGGFPGEGIDFLLSVTKLNTDSGVVLYINDPDSAHFWPTPTNYSRALYVSNYTRGNDTVIHSRFGGTYRITAVNMFPGKAVVFNVLAVTSRSIIEISTTQPITGTCSLHGTVYSLLVPNVTEDVIVYVRPANYDSFNYTSGLSILVGSEPLLSRNASIAYYDALRWNETVEITGNSQSLFDCEAEAHRWNQPYCTLYFQIDCHHSAGSKQVNFLLIAQRAGDILPLQNFDVLPLVKSTKGEAKHYSVFVPDDSQPLRFTVYPCSGQPFLFMSDQVLYPSNNTQQVQSRRSTTAINYLVIQPSLLKPNGSVWYSSVVSYAYDATYQVEVLNGYFDQFDPLLSPAFHRVQITNNEKGAFLVRFQPTIVNPFWIANPIVPGVSYDIVYTVYLVSQYTPPAVLFTHCGLQVAGGINVLEQRNSSFTLTSDGFFETQLSTSHLDASKTYAVNVVARLLLQANGSEALYEQGQLTYDYALVQPNNGGGSDATHESTVIAEIIAAIFLPLFLVAAAVSFFYWRRNKRLQQDLNIELPDIEEETTSAQQRRQIRGGRRANNADESGYASLMENDSLASYK